jgi:hypothetical protein
MEKKGQLFLQEEFKLINVGGMKETIRTPQS